MSRNLYKISLSMVCNITIQTYIMNLNNMTGFFLNQ